MTIKSTTCIEVACGRCGDHQGGDYHGPQHFDSVELARKDHVDSSDGEPWRWDAAGPVCFSCVRHELQKACLEHEWDREPEPTRETPYRFRECRKCGYSDTSTDAGKTWRSERAIVPAPSTDDAAPGDSVKTMECCEVSCNGCGLLDEDDYPLHHPSWEAIQERLAETDWTFDIRTGDAFCVGCAPEPSATTRVEDLHTWVVPGQMDLLEELAAIGAGDVS